MPKHLLQSASLVALRRTSSTRPTPRMPCDSPLSKKPAHPASEVHGGHGGIPSLRARMRSALPGQLIHAPRQPTFSISQVVGQAVQQGLYDAECGHPTAREGTEAATAGAATAAGAGAAGAGAAAPTGLGLRGRFKPAAGVCAVAGEGRGAGAAKVRSPSPGLLRT